MERHSQDLNLQYNDWTALSSLGQCINAMQNHSQDVEIVKY